jgi:branched-chain amino acid aminotransferase/para-aminobenzoate synthetase component 1
MTARGDKSKLIVWLNGEFIDARDAGISPFDRGFLYGDGLFETLRADRGQVHLLEEHLSRLARSAKELRLEHPRTLDFEGLTREILLRNGLEKGAARVRIVVSRGIDPSPGMPRPGSQTVLITAEEFSPPHSLKYAAGWKLSVSNGGFSSSLACHKTLNYLPCLLARQAALSAGREEAIIIDPEGYVAETSTGSILAQNDGSWWTPASVFKLPGVTLGRVIQLFEDSGVEVSERRAKPADLYDARTVWVLNSMLGVMPVCEVGGRVIDYLNIDLAASLREQLFSD